MAAYSTLTGEILRMAYDSVMSHKFRSFLTILGIVVGILTAVVVASILTGMRQSIVSMIDEYGTDNIYLYHRTTGPGGGDRDERNRKPLTVEDAQAIMNQTDAINDIAYQATSLGGWNTGFDSRMIFGDRTFKFGNVQGVTPNYDVISNVSVRDGRWLSEADDRERRKVLVLGVNALEALFDNDVTKAVGSLVRMNGDTWEVIGVMEKRKGGMMGENEEDSDVLMPFRTARKVAPNAESVLLIAQAKPERIEDAIQQIEGVLRQRRNVAPEQKNNFDIKSANDFKSQFDSMIGGIGAAAIAISMLGLLVGGIGVMNIMLVSVTERTKEIGIRKALGATRGAIVFQFLSEAMALTLIGGLIGVVISIAISQLIMALIPTMPATIEAWMIIVSLTVSIGIGLIFGVLPARKAANLDPIEALRYE